MGESRLTDREVQCVTLAGQGLTNKEIALRLRPYGRGMSHRTVGNHLVSAYRKLGTTNRHEAAVLVARNYTVRPIPMADTAAPPSNVDLADAPHGRAGDAAHIPAGPYRIYARLGVWRTPPRWGGSRAGLIVAWACVGLMLISVVLGLVTVFGSIQRAGEQLQRSAPTIEALQ